MANYRSKEKERRGLPGEHDDVTARHLNRARDELEQLGAVFEEELQRRLPPSEFEALQPHLPKLSFTMHHLVALSFYNPHPETFGELDQRIKANADRLPAYFGELANVNFGDEAAKEAFVSTFNALAQRVKTCMTATHAAAPLLQ